MNRSHVIRLNPTEEQEVYFRKACGVARHAYNRALARWKQARAEGKRVTVRELKVEYNGIKHEQFPWCSEVTKCAPEQEFSNLGQAFDNYWRMKKDGTQPKLKHPRKDKETLRLRTDVPGVASSARKFACGVRSSGSFGGETSCDEASTRR